MDWNRIVYERLAKDNELFFVASSVIDSKFGYSIIRKKKFIGIQNNNKILIPPIYDNVEIITKEIAIGKLLDSFAIFSLMNGQQLSDFKYSSIHITNEVIILGMENGRSDLYIFNTSKLLHQTADYDELNLKDFSTEYIWAKRNIFYDYIHRASGVIISLPGIIMAYDTQHDIFGLDEHNKVCKFNEYGVEDTLGLRQAVQKNGGYLTLNNYTYNIEHIIDIYGNILNI